jgi:hypothetical protein
MNGKLGKFMVAVGGIVAMIVGFYVMPIVQKKLEDKIYQKMQ